MMPAPDPEQRLLTAEEIAFCTRLNLEYGFDDDDESKWQFTHVCWPYVAYQGALCGSERLWFHGGLVARRPTTVFDCLECLAALKQLASADAKLLDVIEHLAEAVVVLQGIEQAAQGFLSTTLMTPSFKEAVAAGYPTTSADELRQAIDKDHERHRVRAVAYGERKKESK
jgi:hypothetical protein